MYKHTRYHDPVQGSDMWFLTVIRILFPVEFRWVLFLRLDRLNLQEPSPSWLISGRSSRNQTKLPENPALTWFIESGDYTMLWGREVAKDLTNYMVLDYCQYSGPGYRKTTGVSHFDRMQCSLRPLCGPKSFWQCVDGTHKLGVQRGSCKGQDKQLDRCSLYTLHGLPRELTEKNTGCVSESHVAANMNEKDN